MISAASLISLINLECRRRCLDSVRCNLAFRFGLHEAQMDVSIIVVPRWQYKHNIGGTLPFRSNARWTLQYVSIQDRLQYRDSPLISHLQLSFPCILYQLSIPN